MKLIYKFIITIIFIFFYSTYSVAAERDLDRALETLLAGYNIDEYLKIRDDEEINSGFYEIRPGDTLDEIINRAIGDTSIRNEILREAFVRANPNSFRNSNPNYMFSGVKIRMPTADDIIGLLFKADSRELSSTSRSRQSWVYFP